MATLTAKAALQRGESRTPYLWEGNFASLSPKQEDIIIEPTAPRAWEGSFKGVSSKHKEVISEPSAPNTWEDNFEDQTPKERATFEPNIPRRWEGSFASLGSRNDDILVTFQNLDVEEDQLMEQKELFAAQLTLLRFKAMEEVEKRKQKVVILSSEVSDLKQRCSELANWINSN